MTDQGDRPARATSKGFFLQVEGASIDKQDHATNACGQLGETVAFDEAIGVALDYQRSHPDTLSSSPPTTRTPARSSAEDASGSGLPTGYSTNLLTKDGQTLTLTYGTAGYGGAGAAPVAAPPSQQHTGAVVPVWGKRPGRARACSAPTTTPTCSTRWAAEPSARWERRPIRGRRSDSTSRIAG